MVYGTFYGQPGSIDVINQTKLDQSKVFRYIVKPKDTITSISQHTHTSIDKICQLNPHIFHQNNPKRKIYAGQALIMDDPGIIKLPPTPELIDEGWGQMHVVTNQDTLESIAKTYNTTIDAIRNDNRKHFPVGQRGKLYQGQLLHIRIINTITQQTTHNEHDPIHLVQENDTFESILQEYDITLTELLDNNRLLFPVGLPIQLNAGMKLSVKNTKTIQDRSLRNIGEIQLTKQIHTVQQEDSPESIAKLYSMKLDELREYNRSVFPKGYRGNLKLGQQLVVKKT